MIVRFPWDVTCDKDGYAYVVDNETHNVFKFDHEGKFIMKFGSKGSGPGQLHWPAGISYSKKHLYITDDNNRISIFDTSGSFIRHITLDDRDTGKGDTGKGDTGNTEDEVDGRVDGLKHPLGITADELGKIYISDCWNNRLIIINNN